MSSIDESSGRAAAYERWTRATETPLLVMAVGFLVAYAIPILLPDAPVAVLRTARWFEWLVWVVFAIDYGTRLWLAPDRRVFFRTNLLDLAAVALPMFRALRLLRLLSILTLVTRRSSGARIQAATTYVVGFAALLVVVSSLAVLDAERAAQKPQIQDFGDALWWSLVTMTTVGYGDVVPTSGTGKAVGVLVMMTGIAVLGVVTANVSSAFVAGLSAPNEGSGEQSGAATGEEADELRAEIERLTAELAAARGSDRDPG